MADGDDSEALASDDGAEAWVDGSGTEESAPEPFEPTGDDGVDRVLARLEGLEQRSVHDHVVVFEEVHAGLRRALGGVDRE